MLVVKPSRETHDGRTDAKVDALTIRSIARDGQHGLTPDYEVQRVYCHKRWIW